MNEIPYNSVDLFFEAAKKHPQKPAIIHNGHTISYAELEVEILATAAYFQSKGIGHGDRVLVFVPMSIDLYRNVLALFRIGATAVFLDEWVNRKRLSLCCEVADCKAWIGGWKVQLLSFTSLELRRIPVKLGLSYKKELPLKPVTTVEKDVALITFTTGSTGTPKAAKRTHGFLRAQFAALIDKIDPSPEDIDMPVLPIVLMINLGIGCTSVIAPYKSSKPNSLKPAVILDLLLKHKVTRLVASPFFVKTIAQEIIDQQVKLPQLTKVFTGGAPVFPQEAQLYQTAFSNAVCEIVYGSTESEPISSIRTSELVTSNVRESGGLLVGIPYHGATVKIIEISSEPIVCNSMDELTNLEKKAGEIGEIIVSGDHVLREYLNNEAALHRNKIFIDNACWHRTGDSGFFDPSEQLFLTGRCDSLIEHNGQIISTFIVENELQLITEINIATVLKIKDKLIAVIELNKGVSSDEKLLLKLKSILPFLDELAEIKRMPRDPRHHSKIEYAKLRELLNR